MKILGFRLQRFTSESEVVAALTVQGGLVKNKMKGGSLYQTIPTRPSPLTCFFSIEMPLFRQATFYLAELFCQATFYLAKLFRQATFYLVELFRQATFYLAELFRQATFYLAGLSGQIPFLDLGWNTIACRLLPHRAMDTQSIGHIGYWTHRTYDTKGQFVHQGPQRTLDTQNHSHKGSIRHDICHIEPWTHRDIDTQRHGHIESRTHRAVPLKIALANTLANRQNVFAHGRLLVFDLTSYIARHLCSPHSSFLLPSIRFVPSNRFQNESPLILVS